MTGVAIFERIRHDAGRPLALVASARADASFALNPEWEWDIAAEALRVAARLHAILVEGLEKAAQGLWLPQSMGT